jgi:hypothetical protein
VGHLVFGLAFGLLLANYRATARYFLSGCWSPFGLAWSLIVIVYRIVTTFLYRPCTRHYVPRPCTRIVT